MGEKKLNKKGKIETLEGKIGKGQIKDKFYFFFNEREKR